jgi:hypothetical protein
VSEWAQHCTDANLLLTLWASSESDWFCSKDVVLCLLLDRILILNA